MFEEDDDNHSHRELEKSGVANIKTCYINDDEFCTLFVTPITDDGNYMSFRLTHVTHAELEILYDAESAEEMEMLCGNMLRMRRHNRELNG